MHLLVGVVLFGVVGMVIGLNEPQLVRFIAERMPTDNPLAKQLVTIGRRGQEGGKKKKKRT